MKKLMMAVGAVMMSAAALAAGSFAYQGVLRDEVGGRLKDVTATITFRLYDGPDDSATVLWDKDMTLSIDTNGLFNAELTGAGKTVGASIDDVISDAQKGTSKTLYVGLTVKDSSGEIRPRQKIIATPLALFASDVKEARGDFTVNGDATILGDLAMMGTNSHLSIVQADVSGSFRARDGLVAEGKAELMGGATVDNGLTANTLTVKKEANINDLVVSGTALTPSGVEIGVPDGCILMWSGAEDSVPTGWAICDGRKLADGFQTPDLRGRFIVGVGNGGTGTTYTLGQNNGGVEKVTLSTQEMPAHRHRYLSDDSINDKGYGDHPYAKTYEHKKYDFDFSSSGSTRGCSYYNEKVGGDDKGNTVAHENRPPFYALYYIIKHTIKK